MIEIKESFAELGMFETYVGELLFVNGHAIIPFYNLQLDRHPLNHGSDEIAHLKYGIGLFFNVRSSEREVHSTESPFPGAYKKADYINEEIAEKATQEYLIEAIDYQNTFQYWNWKIHSHSFSLIVPGDNRELIRKAPWTINELDSTTLEILRNHNLEFLRKYFDRI